MGDRVFRMVMSAAAYTVLAITGGIGLFLGVKAVPVIHTLGWSFFTTANWDPETTRSASPPS